jgi:hypothetical protein
MDARDHVLALTVRGQSLLELIGNASGSPRSAGSQAVLELEGIITELRRIYPPPLFKVAEPLLYPIVNPRLSDARRISGDKSRGRNNTIDLSPVNKTANVL